jgi:hypothetical protein
MKRLLTGLSGLALVCLILAACGGIAAAPTAAPKADGDRPSPASAAPTAPVPTDRPATTNRPAAEPTKPAAAPRDSARPAPSSADPYAPAAEPADAVPVGPDASAPARPAPTAVAASEPGRGADAPAEGAALDHADGATSPCRACPRPYPTPVQAPRSPLRAGAVDDNQRFDEYLAYLRGYRGPTVWPVDVSERYLISVTDADQRPVANGVVRVYHDQRLVFTGRTYAGGQTIFFPAAIPDAVQADEFVVTAEKDGRLATRSFTRGGGGPWALTLDGRAQRSPLVRLDLLFLIDSTGSMGGEIAKIQSTLVSISDRIARLGGQPAIRYAGVTYRDRGDQYVVRKFGFTDDLQRFQGWLSGIRAGGGGDYPESLNEALHVAVGEMDWDQGEAVRLVFLVADAPPHLDYPNDYRYPAEAALAVTKGIKLYTIGASGLTPQGEYVFRQLAQLTLGQFMFITRGGDEQSGGGPVSATNIQSPENNLDDIVVRIVTQELRLLA